MCVIIIIIIICLTVCLYMQLGSEIRYVLYVVSGTTVPAASLGSLCTGCMVYV